MSDMWLPEGQDPREALTDDVKGEKKNAIAYLESYRMTLELKCADLTPEQLGTRSVTPSTLSLLGLVRHLARVEHHWFRRAIEGRTELNRLFSGPDDDAGFAFGTPDQALVDEAWSLWRTEVDHAREVLDAHDMDELVDYDGEEVEVRDIVVHMIEEYARHVGHADLLRECLDGRTGQ